VTVTLAAVKWLGLHIPGDGRSGDADMAAVGRGPAYLLGQVGKDLGTDSVQPLHDFSLEHTGC
jgi:hypothetical protein